MVALLAVWMYMMPMETIIPVEFYDELHECTTELNNLGYDLENMGLTQSVYNTDFEELFLVCYRQGVEV